MYPSLKGKTAIVTGASRGIGRGIALALASEGVNLVLNARNASSLEETCVEAKKYGISFRCVIGDMADPATAHKLAAETIQYFGRIDILVNNAGIQNRKRTDELTIGDWDRMIAINESGVFYMCKAVLPFMTIAKSGSIINITSTASKTPHPNAAVCYGASKAAVTYLTKHLATEFGPEGVRVNAVQCGPIRSDMTDQWTDEYRASVMKKIPLGRLGTPEDVASAVLFLASDEASWITGCSLNCSGGKYTE